MTSVSGLWSSATFVGYSTSANTATVTSGLTSVAASIASHSSTAYYVIGSYTTSVTATFYYNSNTTSGGTTISNTTASGTQTRNVYCSSTSAAATSVKSNGSIAIPDAVKGSGSVGTYNNAYVGVQGSTSTTAPGNMSNITTSATTAYTYYFAAYRTTVANHYPSSTSACASQTLYRNQWFTNTTEMATTVISTSTTGTSNFTPTTVT